MLILALFPFFFFFLYARLGIALGSLLGSLLVVVGDDAGEAFESVDTFLVFFFFRLFKSSCPMDGNKFCLLSSGY